MEGSEQVSAYGALPWAGRIARLQSVLFGRFSPQRESEDASAQEGSDGEPKSLWSGRTICHSAKLQGEKVCVFHHEPQAHWYPAQLADIGAGFPGDDPFDVVADLLNSILQPKTGKRFAFSIL